MPSLMQYKAQIIEKRAAQKKIIRDVEADEKAKGIIRDMSEDEQARFDALETDIVALKARVDKLEAIEDDEDAMDDDTVVVDEDGVERSIRRDAGHGRGRQGNPIRNAPAVHTKQRSYSIIRAINCVLQNRPIDGLEGEISREIANVTGQAPNGFYMPTGSNPEMLARMYPGSAAKGDAIRRDLTTTTGSGGIFLVPEMPMIELLRARLVVRALGARFLDGLRGTFAFPRQATKATVNWLGEGNSATPSNQTVDQVPFTPKVAIALTNISRQLLNQTSLDAEQFVKEDLAETMAREIDRVALNGSGGTQPTGILQNSTIATNSAGIALGANGGAFTYQAAIAMEGLVAGYNADRGSLGYCLSPALRAELKNTAKIGSTFPTFVYEDGPEIGVGMINGYPARTTTNMPTNLTKGSGTNLKAAIYGNWNDLIVGQWEGVDILVNPYTNQASGAITISMCLSLDVEVRHPESFSIITDAT